MASDNSSSGGIGFFGLLGVAFIVLKLTGFINWPWLWVLAPIWGSFALVVGILAIVGVVMLGLHLSDKRRGRVRGRKSTQDILRG